MSDLTSTSRARGETPKREEFSRWLPLRTRNRDTDQFGHVNHAAMATLFEESRIALIFAPEFEKETRGLDLLVAKLTMTFHEELRAPGDIEIGAEVLRIGSSSLDIRQAIFSKESCYVSADAVCVFLDRSARKPSRVSDSLRAQLIRAR